MARTRVIYQSEALFVSDGTVVPTAAHATGNIKQIHRVQSANYGLDISRVDVNQYGTLGRIDSLIVEAPTVNLDFSYFLGTGNNERDLGFTVGSAAGTAQSFISGLIDGVNNPISVVSGRNFHILTAAEGLDANTLLTGTANLTGSAPRTISFGNSYITSYSVEAAVGSLPTVTVSAEALNMTVSTGTSGIIVPGLTIETSAPSTNTAILPAPNTGAIGTTALRPGDISVVVVDGVAADLPSGIAFTDNTVAHIQSFSIECPIGRSTLERLGSKAGFAKVIDFPITVTCNMNAIVADLKNSGSLEAILSADTNKKLAFALKTSGNERIVFELRGAKLASENYSSAIGDNKTVDLTFTTQIGNDTANGLFVWTQTSAYQPADIVN